MALIGHRSQPRSRVLSSLCCVESEPPCSPLCLSELPSPRSLVMDSHQLLHASFCDCEGRVSGYPPVSNSSPFFPLAMRAMELSSWATSDVARTILLPASMHAAAPSSPRCKHLWKAPTVVSRQMGQWPLRKQWTLQTCHG